MPAGNDAQAAVTELADRFGLGDARAEDLVNAHAAQYPKELVAAQMLDKDEDLTEEADWGKAAKAVDVKKADVIDIAVRGDICIVVHTDEQGRPHKSWCEIKDIGLSRKRGGGSAKAKKS